MPERANSLASAFFAGTLAAAGLAGVNMTASAADCLDGPDLRMTQPGHWYYHSDRSQNRKCWYFQPAEVKPPEAPVNAPAPTPAPAAAADEDAQPSLLSRLATGFGQPFYSQQQQIYSQPPQGESLQQREPPQNSNSDNSVEATQAVSPRPAKPGRTARQERPRIVPPPTTSGAASTERRDPTQQSAAEKNEKRDSPPNVADREALFQDFVKWQMERNVFGGP